MYPDLSYILHSLIGTEPDNAASIVKTFGLFLVLAILFASWLLNLEFKRKEKEGIFKPVKAKMIIGEQPQIGEILTNALLGFFLLFKAVYAYQNFDTFKDDPASVILSLDGTLWAGIVGAVLFGALKYWDKKRLALDKPQEKMINIYPHDRIGDITIFAAISGIVGAKVFAMIEDLDLVFDGVLTWSQFFSNFFSGSGMAIYGGLIFGVIFSYFYLKRINVPAIHAFDAVAPALMFSYGIGRLGCHFSGDGDWGIPIEKYNEAGELVYKFEKPGFMNILPDWLWGFDYPHNVIDEGSRMADCAWRYCHKLDGIVFPTSIYEFWMAMALGGLLWSLRKRIKIPGLLFFIYVLLNGIERFFIEKIRVNEKYDVFGIQSTQAEVIAVVLMIIGIIGIIIVRARSKTNAA